MVDFAYSDLIFLENPDDRTERSLDLEEIQYILNYTDKNPNSTLHEISYLFSDIFGRKIDHTIVRDLIRESSHQSFLQEVNEKAAQQQNADKNVSTTEKLGHPPSQMETSEKYDGFGLARKKPAKTVKEIEKERIMETFSQDLYEEMSHRQSLTDEYLSNDKLRALALEVAADPKYEGHLSNTFSYQWISRFRKKFNIESSRTRFVSTIDQKLQIIQFIENNQGVSYGEVGRHFSKVFGRQISRWTVRGIHVNREKYLEKQNEQSQDVVIIGEESGMNSDMARKNFSLELYEELSRRQNLTEDDLTSIEEIRSLALEIAHRPKYEQYFSSYKFSNGWIESFRENFNLARK